MQGYLKPLTVKSEDCFAKMTVSDMKKKKTTLTSYASFYNDGGKMMKLLL